MLPLTVTALCRRKPAPAFAMVAKFIGIILIFQVESILRKLLDLIYENDETLLESVLWAYSGVTEQSSKPHLFAVAEQKIAQRLIELLANPSEKIYYPALRVIGNILVSDVEEHTRMFLYYGILGVLEKFMSHEKLSMRKEVMWSFSNIAATSQDCIQAILDFGLLPRIISNIQQDDVFIRKEAVFACANMLWKGTAKQINTIFNFGCLEPMIQLVLSLIESSHAFSDQLTQIVLETFENLLKESLPTENLIQYSNAINKQGSTFILQVISQSVNSDCVRLGQTVLGHLSEFQRE
jgi:hypothetical protein